MGEELIISIEHSVVNEGNELSLGVIAMANEHAPATRPNTPNSLNIGN